MPGVGQIASIESSPVSISSRFALELLRGGFAWGVVSLRGREAASLSCYWLVEAGGARNLVSLHLQKYKMTRVSI